MPVARTRCSLPPTWKGKLPALALGLGRPRANQVTLWVLLVPIVRARAMLTGVPAGYTQKYGRSTCPGQLGASEFRTPLPLWKRKRGLRPRDEGSAEGYDAGGIS